MSDLVTRSHVSAADARTLEQSYTLRGWLTALLAQTLQTEATIRNRIAEIEHEAQRLRVQLDHTEPTIRFLRQTINSVDGAIRSRFAEIRAGVPARAPSPAGRTPESPVKPSAQEPAPVNDETSQRSRPRRK